MSIVWCSQDVKKYMYVHPIVITKLWVRTCVNSLHVVVGNTLVAMATTNAATYIIDVRAPHNSTCVLSHSCHVQSEVGLWRGWVSKRWRCVRDQTHNWNSVHASNASTIVATFFVGQTHVQTYNRISSKSVFKMLANVKRSSGLLRVWLFRVSFFGFRRGF